MLYLAIILDKVQFLLGWGLGLSITFIIIYFITMAAMFNVEGSDARESAAKFMKHFRDKKPWRIPFIIAICCAVISTILPNTKEAVIIYIIPKVITASLKNEQLMRIPNNVLKMANTYMENKILKWTKDSEVLKDSSSVAPDTQKNIHSDSRVEKFLDKTIDSVTNKVIDRVIK